MVTSQRDERLIGAIHIVEMLRSVNDTSLSDWQGVIGEELEKQKEKQEEAEARKEQVIEENLEKLTSSLEGYRQEVKESANESRIIAQIDNMRSELTAVALGLRGGIRRSVCIASHRNTFKNLFSLPGVSERC